MKPLFILLTAAMLFSPLMIGSSHAVPANPRPMEITQPNGDKLTIRLRGDERHHWYITEDGVLISLNKKDYYCYAYINKKGETVAGRKIAHNENERTKCEKCYIARLQKKTEKNRHKVQTNR